MSSDSIENIHKDYIVEINPRVTLRKTFRRIIHDQFMWIYLNAEESQEMIHHALDLKGNPTAKERITIATVVTLVMTMVKIV